MSILLTQQEQTYLDKLLANFKERKKLNDIQQLILDLGKQEKKADDDIKKLKLLLKSEKMNEDALAHKKKTLGFLKEEQEKKLQLENENSLLVGKVLLSAIKDNKQLDENYSYAKILKKMNEQGLFGEKGNHLLAEFLVEDIPNIPVESIQTTIEN